MSISIERRNFLKFGITTTLSLLTIPELTLAQIDPSVRHINLYRQVTGERLKGHFYYNGKYDEKFYKEFCWFMRDIHEDKATIMQPYTINMLWYVQSVLDEVNINKNIIITSGYRTQKTNAKLENAAYNSKHLTGQATDFYVENVQLSTVAKIVYSKFSGGIGYYPKNGFIHIDNARPRIWRG